MLQNDWISEMRCCWLQPRGLGACWVESCSFPLWTQHCTVCFPTSVLTPSSQPWNCLGLCPSASWHRRCSENTCWMDRWWGDDFLFGSQLPTLRGCHSFPVCFSPPLPPPSLLWVCVCLLLSLVPSFLLSHSLSVFGLVCFSWNLSLSWPHSVPLCLFFHFSLTFSSKLLTFSDDLCSQLETGLLAHSFFPFSLWLSPVFSKFREEMHKLSSSPSPTCPRVGRSQRAAGTRHPAVLMFSACCVRGCPPGLWYLIWNLVRKLQWSIFTFGGTFLACRVGALQTDFFLCTTARVCQEFYYGNHYFCLSIFPSSFPILIYFHLPNIGIFFRVLALRFSSKTQNNRGKKWKNLWVKKHLHPHFLYWKETSSVFWTENLNTIKGGWKHGL